MSKIELTEAQTEKLRRVWLVETTHAKALVAVANELVAMGLVRPAHNDLAARVAALEAKYETLATATLDPSDVDETPDPHAAAKERAKLWGVELVECGTDEMGWGKWMFRSDSLFYDYVKHKPQNSAWVEFEDEVPISEMHGYYRTPDEAWSNFPTVPPPGWEAAKPRTDADRLGALADAAYMAYTHDSWESHKQAAIPNDWRNVALAVRKAVLAAQLEPSEEEHKAANMAYLECSSANVDTAVKAALIAAARVRLEKVEGEQ